MKSHTNQPQDAQAPTDFPLYLDWDWQPEASLRRFTPQAILDALSAPLSQTRATQQQAIDKSKQAHNTLSRRQRAVLHKLK